MQFSSSGTFPALFDVLHHFCGPAEPSIGPLETTAFPDVAFPETQRTYPRVPIVDGSRPCGVPSDVVRLRHPGSWSRAAGVTVDKPTRTVWLIRCTCLSPVHECGSWGLLVKPTSSTGEWN